MKSTKKIKKEERKIPEKKRKALEELINLFKTKKTFLLASIKGLPSRQFNEIKKKLRQKVIIKVPKKTILLKALNEIKDSEIEKFKEKIKEDTAIFFSDINPFELSLILSDNQSPTKAKAGDIPEEDIVIEPGPTSLVPGPAISELSSVGLKVSVEGGKIAIKQQHIIAKAGEPIKENVANVLGKLDIQPIKIGFEPIAAYDSQRKKLYGTIKIDKKGFLNELKENIKKALGFAVNIKYPTKESITFFIRKAGIEEKAIEKIIKSKEGVN